MRDNALHYLLMYMYCLTLMVWKLNVRHGPDVPIDDVKYDSGILMSHRDGEEECYSEQQIPATSKK